MIHLAVKSLGREFCKIYLIQIFIKPGQYDSSSDKIAWTFILRNISDTNIN